MRSASDNPPGDTADGNESEEARAHLEERSLTEDENLGTCDEPEVDENADGAGCQKILKENRNSLKLLLAMAIGCVTQDDIIASMDAEPCKSAREKKSLFPTGEQLKDEVIRRARLFELNKEPRPNGWNCNNDIQCKECATKLG
jgi:hypothetical protein